MFQEFDTGMKDLLAFIKKHEPKICVSEQVEGFGMPFIAGGAETPLARLPVTMAQVLNPNPKLVCSEVLKSSNIANIA